MAGFVLEAADAALANKEDPHAVKVFDPSIKGKTDRFAYRFVRRRCVLSVMSRAVV